MVDPAGMTPTRSNAISPRRSAFVAVLPINMESPAPLLSAPLSENRLLSFLALMFIRLAAIWVEVGVGVGVFKLVGVVVAVGEGVGVSVAEGVEVGVGVVVAVGEGVGVSVAEGVEVGVGVSVGVGVGVSVTLVPLVTNTVLIMVDGWTPQ